MERPGRYGLRVLEERLKMEDKNIIDVLHKN